MKNNNNDLEILLKELNCQNIISDCNEKPLRNIKVKGKSFMSVDKNTDGSLKMVEIIFDDDDFEENIEEFQFMSGIDFLNSVRNGQLNFLNGSISDIIVNGYSSNLGLIGEDIVDGHFLVTYEVFEQICINDSVIVNWESI